MTHNDIYTKFMIEYDKANVTSSYPSLTEYEVATFLDKAYNALIAQKVTGNNVRRAPFEADIKSISDLRGLVKTEIITDFSASEFASNGTAFVLPTDFLYFVAGTLPYDVESENDFELADVKFTPIKLVDHQTATKFFSSRYNIPWIKIPVAYIENAWIYVIEDPSKVDRDADYPSELSLTYIKKPNLFAKNIHDTTKFPANKTWSYFTYPDDAGTTQKEYYTFECNDSMAEELISLAITFALENVESLRLNTKLNTRGLEA